MLSAITKSQIHEVYQYEEVNKTSSRSVKLDKKGKERIEKGFLYLYVVKKKDWARYPVTDALQEETFFEHLNRAKACKKNKRLAYYDDTLSDAYRMGTVKFPEDS